jgi:hypothetical protein
MKLIEMLISVGHKDANSSALDFGIEFDLLHGVLVPKDISIEDVRPSKK